MPSQVRKAVSILFGGFLGLTFGIALSSLQFFLTGYFNQSFGYFVFHHPSAMTTSKIVFFSWPLLGLIVGVVLGIRRKSWPLWLRLLLLPLIGLSTGLFVYQAIIEFILLTTQKFPEPSYALPMLAAPALGFLAGLAAAFWRGRKKSEID